MRWSITVFVLATACGPSLRQVQEYAEQRQLQPDAPVHAESSVEVQAPIELVWSIFSAVDDWPKWNDDAAEAQMNGNFGPGTELVYGKGTQHDLMLTVVEVPTFVSFFGLFAGYKGVTLWSFEAVSRTVTKVTAKESNDGFMISIFYSSSSLEKHLALWTGRLKAEAERQFTASAEAGR